MLGLHLSTQPLFAQREAISFGCIKLVITVQKVYDICLKVGSNSNLRKSFV